MKVRVLTVGRPDTPWAEAAVDVYRSRLKRWVPVEEAFVKPEVFRGDVERVRAAEAERLAAAVGERDRLYVLDERGDAPDSDAFLRLVEACQTSGCAGMTWAIGGPYGHGPALRERAFKVIRLSSLVLNHEIARVVLWEQLYRAWARQNGTPYHH